MATTTYDIKVRYMLDDRASKGVTGIGRAADRASKSTGMLNKSIKRLMILGAGVFGFRVAKKLLIDYNSEMQQARIQMAGLTSMNMGGSWARNQKRANFLVRQFQKDAAASVGTTADFVEMGKNIVGPLSQGGAKMGEIAEITKGAVIAGKSFGLQTEQTAKDIRSAVFGQVTSKDMLMVQLLGASGQSVKDWNKIAKQSPEKAIKGLRKLLGKENKSLMLMAKAQENSWEGVTSTLEDSLQRAFAKVGIPLMKVMTAEIQKLTKWFDENPEKVNEIAKNIGEGLVSAFKTLKTMFGFILKHKDFLLTLAKVALVTRGVGMVASGIGGLTGFFAASNAANGAATSMLGFSRGLGGVVSGMTRAVGMLGVAYIGAKAVAGAVDAHQEKQIKRDTDNPLLIEQARLLGGAAGGSGSNIMDAGITGAQRNAKRRGFRDDVGSAFAPRGNGNNFGDKEAKRLRDQALRSGKFTAADKDRARRIVSSSESAGFVNDGKVNFGKVRDRVGGGAGGLKNVRIMAEAVLRAGGKSKFAAMSPGKMAEALMAANKSANVQSIHRMSQFLLGLERANKIAAMQNWQAFQPLRKFGSNILKFIGVDPFSGKKPGDVKDDGRTGVKPKSPTIKIGKIEIVSDDPDRFGMNLVGVIEDINKSPTQAKRTISEGR